MFCQDIIINRSHGAGACVSPDMPDNEDARMWFNCVEEMVFIDEDFNSDSAPPPELVAYRRKIQALQAAYMVCLYQNWEGTDASKSRIRRYRFATLVSVSFLLTTRALPVDLY
jgi:hypothetical protein